MPPVTRRIEISPALKALKALQPYPHPNVRPMRGQFHQRVAVLDTSRAREVLLSFVDWISAAR
jgi:hypothetical protein